MLHCRVNSEFFKENNSDYAKKAFGLSREGQGGKGEVGGEGFFGGGGPDVGSGFLGGGEGVLRGWGGGS